MEYHVPPLWGIQFKFKPEHRYLYTHMWPLDAGLVRTVRSHFTHSDCNVHVFMWKCEVLFLATLVHPEKQGIQCRLTAVEDTTGPSHTGLCVYQTEVTMEVFKILDIG